MVDKHDNEPPVTGNTTSEGPEDEYARVLRRFTRANRDVISRDPAPVPEFLASKFHTFSANFNKR